MFLVVLFLLTPAVRGKAADQKASVPQKAPAPPPSPVIPLAGGGVAGHGGGGAPAQASTPATSMIEKQLPEASALIGLETLEVKQERWTKRQLLTTTWLDALRRSPFRLNVGSPSSTLIELFAWPRRPRLEPPSIDWQLLIDLRKTRAL